MTSISSPETLANHSLKEDIRAYWSKRAETFDQQTGHRIENEAEAPAWRALFRRGLGEINEKRILDLACGTGEISRILLSMGADVTGVDFAEPMLARANIKNAEGRFRGRLADVETLIMEQSASYDAVVTRHLVWTLIDPHSAFANWFRVLKPGGRILIVDGDWVNVNSFGRILRAIAARLSKAGRGMHGDEVDPTAHARILADIHYADGLRPDQLIADLGRHGFVDCQVHSMSGVYLWGMRRAPLADRLRLNAARRFAVSATKPGA